jgi:hypothetical protein
MTRIVRYAHRYKRPPGKQKVVALEVPVVMAQQIREPHYEEAV